MSPKVSKAKPATVQDVDEETKRTIPGTKVSANSDMRPSPPSKDRDARHQTTDTTSDSGRSNHTYETLASADSAKLMPRAPEPPKDKKTNLPTAANIPPPTTTDAPKSSPPKKSSRTSSPGKKHRRAESKSSKKSSDPVPVAYQGPCACQDCDAYYRAYAAYPQAHYPHPHHAAYAQQPPPYYPPAGHVVPGAEYDHQPRLRRTSRPRPLSYHTAPSGYEPYAMAAPAHLAGMHDPRDPYDQIDRRDYLDRAGAEPTVDMLPTIRASPYVSHAQSRPIMQHAHTDYPVAHRHSAFIEYPPVFGDDDTMLHDYPSSYGRQSGFPPQYMRASSRSPTRAGAEAYPRRPSRDEFSSHPPISMRVARRPSVKHPSLEPTIETGRATSRTRRDRSYTDLDSFRKLSVQENADYDIGRSARAPSHSRRHSQYIDVPSRDASKHSRSPGHRYTTSESRSHRPTSYYSYEDQAAAKQSKRRSRDVGNSGDKYDEARKYQETVNGRNDKDKDELTNNVHRSYSNAGKKPGLPGRVPSLRSAHSGRSHRSGRQSVDGGSGASRRGEDIRVEVKVIQNGQTINKQKFAGSADFSVNDDGTLSYQDRSYHGSSGRSTASVISGFFSRRGSSGKDKDDGTRESRRRSRVASPIIEDVRAERRESRRYH
ncbi:Hypothetical protein D9617_17g046050 [Elsinoe fawcettii]|nr:Hypothetical protein D9617_17g046050 [Elsinoe fawcettii]